MLQLLQVIFQGEIRDHNRVLYTAEWQPGPIRVDEVRELPVDCKQDLLLV